MAYCFGAHLSIAGGLHLAAQRASELNCDCLQIFTKNNNQWNCKPISDTEAMQFTQAVELAKLQSTIAHTSYLINMASPDDALWKKSLDALVIEWRRAEQLGLAGLVVHPGAHMTASPEHGLSRIVQAVQSAIETVQPAKCRLLLENTAGQGSSLGWQFDQLGVLLRDIGRHPWVGVCLDSCHAFAAGYDFREATGLKKMLSDLEQHIGFEHLHAIHINDSKKDCGSRVDRHEHIGQGKIGEDAFSRFLKAKPIKQLPMFLETDKGIDPASGEEWDAINLATLRRLVGRKSR